MSGLVGMVAKRGGEVLGRVVLVGYASDDSIRVTIRTPDGVLCRCDSLRDLTFHPADPAPSVEERVWTEANFTMWAKVEDALNDLRHDLRTTLGLPAEATDAEIVASVRSIIHPAESAIEDAKPAWAAQRAVPFQSHEWEDEDDNRTLCAACHCTRLDSGHHDRSIEECPARLRDILGEAPAVDADADQMTADPPPARASGRRVKIAAQLARGELLPRSGRLSARESKRLEQQHRDAAVALRKAHDEPAYTSDPPPPSPDGDTFYRKADIPGAATAFVWVRGDHYCVVWDAEGDREWFPWRKCADAQPTPTRLRTANPVPRPEWAEGEGTHSARSLRFPAEVTCACPDGFKPQSQGVGIGCEECKSYLHPGDEHYAALDAWMRAQDDEG